MGRKIFVFGDSIAFGAWDTEGGWVARLRREAHARYVSSRDEDDYRLIYNLSVPGDTSDDVLRRLEGEINSRQIRDPLPTTVVVAIGTNDLKREPAFQVPVGRYRANLTRIGETLRRHGAQWVLVGLPVLGPPCINRRLEDVRDYEKVIREVADEFGVTLVPLLDTTAEASDVLDPDGVHLSPKGHAVVATAVGSVLF